jgi:hypothetical protein
MNITKPIYRKAWFAVLCWVTFVAGLLVQLQSPGLGVSEGKFVIPDRYTQSGGEFNPKKLVDQERRTQLISGILTPIGAIGLGFYYWRTLRGSNRKDKPQPTDRERIASAQ